MTNTKILGIDEAGRGCVIGPMVLAAVLVNRKSWDQLLKAGVEDSKQLSAKRREELAKKVREIAHGIEIAIVLPEKIDNYCRKNRLNFLEAEVATELIRLREPDLVYIDAPGKGGKKFGSQIKTLLDVHQTCIIAENHADQNYVAVAAASILAKVTRDAEIEKLRQEFGDFGSGYPSDSKTQKFIKDLYQKSSQLPSYIRKSWATVRRLEIGEQSQFFAQNIGIE